MRLIKIGKSNSNDIVIKTDNTVSREHLQIFIDDEANVFVTDMQSMNGTFVNGEKISEPVILKTYDILKIGNTLINWRAYLSENVSAEDAYKTIVDDDKEKVNYNEDDPFSDSYSEFPASKKKKTVYLWFAIMILILVGIGIFFYLDADKNNISGKWVSQDNKNLIYTFNSDNTFTRDSLGIVHSGTYSFNDNKEIKLNYDNQISYLTDTSNLDGNISDSYNDYDPKEEYAGGIFEFINKSSNVLKIVDLVPKNYIKNQHNLKVYLLNHSYKRAFQACPLCGNYWYGTNDSILDLVIDNKRNIFNDIVVEPGQLISLMILSDIKTSLTSDSSFFDNNFFSLSDFRFVQTFRGE